MARQHPKRNIDMKIAAITRGERVPSIHDETLTLSNDQAEAFGIVNAEQTFAIVIHADGTEFIYSGLRAIKTGFSHWRVDLSTAELITTRDLKGGG